MNHFYFCSEDDVELRNPTGSMFWLFSIFSPRSLFILFCPHFLILWLLLGFG